MIFVRKLKIPIEIFKRCVTIKATNSQEFFMKKEESNYGIQNY